MPMVIIWLWYGEYDSGTDPNIFHPYTNKSHKNIIWTRCCTLEDFKS